jgi:hypothetical protein
MVRERRLPHAHRLRQFALVAGLADLEVEQDQPDRQRAARRHEGVVERPLHRAGRLVQPQADGDAKRFRHGGIIPRTL